MPSSYTTSLRLTLPATGELSGTWGTTVNTGITELTDAAIAGYVSVAMTDADYTLTVANGLTDQARRMMLNITGTLTVARNVICPTASKLYIIKNSTTGGFAITLKTSAGSGISIPNGSSMLLMCDGTNVVNAVTNFSSLTLGSPLVATSGGTGQSAYAVGDLLYASTTTALSKLADVATGNALISGGVGVAPSWGKIGLTTHVTGTLPVANGGTGITSFGAGVATWLGTPSSANLAAAVTDETGSGALVFGTSPTLASPIITGTGTAAFGNLSYTGTLTGSTGVIAIGTNQFYKDASGNVGLGTISPAVKLEIVGSSSGATIESVRLSNNGAGGSTQSKLSFASSTTIYAEINGGYGVTSPQLTFNLPTVTVGNFVWQNAGVEVMRLNTVGSLNIGTTAVAGTTLQVSKNITGSTNSNGVFVNGQIQSDVTVSANSFRSTPTLASSTFTLPTLQHFFVSASGPANSTILSNEYGLTVSALVAATASYGVYSQVAAQPAGFGPVTRTALNISQSTTTVTVQTTVAHGYITGQYVTVASTANATDLTTGARVTILTLGDTDFTLIGAASNTVGVSFVANAVTPLGTGTVTLNAQGSGRVITVTGTDTFTYVYSTPSTYAAITVLTGVITPAARWNIYALGSAPNYFAGVVGIGGTPATATTLDIGRAITGGVNAYSIYNDGQIQADVTTAGYYSRTQASTAGAVGSVFHNTAVQSTFGGTVTNQYGYSTQTSLIGATNNYAFHADNTASVTAGKTAYGFYSAINKATGGGATWGLYMTGSADNYIAGALGLGTTGVSSVNLRLGKSITGATSAHAIYSEGIVQSDVTVSASYNTTVAQTVGAVGVIYHYNASQNTFGGAVTTQYGFNADSSVIGATNNYAFYAENTTAVTAGKTAYGYYSAINTATGGGATYGLYMAGTANNYIAGSLGIGTAAPSFKLDVSVGTNTIAQQWGIASQNFKLRLLAGDGLVANSSVYRLYLDYLNGTSTNGFIDFYRGNDGTTGFLTFGTTNTERMRIDAAGNVGIGVTPSAWGTAERALDIGSTVALARGGAAELRLTYNAFVNSSAQYIYKVTAAASVYQQTAGTHQWFNAPSGTAGNVITFTQAMTLNASGNLGIGVASPIYKLDVQDPSAATIRARTTTSGNATIIVSTAAGGAANLELNTAAGSSFVRGGIGGTQNLSFDVGGERMRIDSAGNLGLGVTAFGTSAAQVLGMANATAPTTSPAGMGQLYVEGGALKFRGSSGTVTTIAPA